MTIGLLYEGRLDIGPVKILVKRILGREDIEFIPYPAEGQIVTKMSAAMARFKGEQVDLVIFIGDIDKYPERRFKINKFVRESPSSDPSIVAALCNPHFEEWFIVEKDCLTSVLGVDPEDSLSQHPLRNNPKEMINVLISQKSRRIGEVLFETDIYCDLAEKMNLTSLSRHETDFKKFKEALLEKAGEITE